MITNHINQHPDLQGFSSYNYRRGPGKSGWRLYKFPNIDGQFVSVTSTLGHIVHKELQNWMKTQSKNAQFKILMESARIGTAIHKAIECDNDGLMPELVREETTRWDESGKQHDEKGFDIRKAFDNWLDLKAKHNIKSVYQEMSVYDEDLQIAGMFDMVGYFEGQPCLMDIKSGNQVSTTASWQCAIYKYMFENLFKKQTGKDINLGLVILHIQRDGDIFEAIHYPDTKRALEGYVGALVTFRDLYKKELEEANWNGCNPLTILNN